MKNTESIIRQISEVNTQDIQNKLSTSEKDVTIENLVSNHNIMVQYIASIHATMSKKEKDSFENKYREKNKNSKNNGSSRKNRNRSENDQPGQKGKKSLPEGEIFETKLEESEKICPCCGKNLHKQKSQEKTIVVAVPMMSTETHIAESYRCIYCDITKTAPMASTATDAECIGRYHASAVATVAALRYQYGTPSNRIETLSDAIGLSIPDSTQWLLFDEAAEILQPFFEYWQQKVANTEHYATDDTSNRVLSLMQNIRDDQEKAAKEGKQFKDIRSGINTTGVIGIFEGDKTKKIILYMTGIHHAGEILSRILTRRTKIEKPTVMADASSTTTSKILTKTDVQMANCNSHAIRKFIELLEQDENVALENNITDYQPSDFLVFFVHEYGKIFKNDHQTRKMENQTRLEFHAQHSLPVMKAIYNKITEIFQNKSIEPNGELAKTCKYFQNHYTKLIAFCEISGAPVCNNLCERILKNIIRHRKNSLFYKTKHGAEVGDILSSILFTAKENNINSIDYFKDLIIYRDHWASNPEAWLPWRYPETLKNLQNCNRQLE